MGTVLVINKVSHVVSHSRLALLGFSRFQILSSSRLEMTTLSEDDITKIVQRIVQKNNQALQDSMKEMLKESSTEHKRLQTESADSQIRKIKKLKLDEPRRFKKKANEDQFP